MDDGIGDLQTQVLEQGLALEELKQAGGAAWDDRRSLGESNIPERPIARTDT